METPYDEVFDVKHDTTRKERESTIMAALHAIPKKIADTAQTQGVSEQFLTNGIPSGVINPSMMSHDRYLSFMDAIQDATIIIIIITVSPLLPLNTFTIILYTIFTAYWLFHVAWWEKAKIWDIKASVKRYINNTYRWYWAFLFLILTPVAYGLWHFIFELSLQSSAFEAVNSALSVTAGAEKAIAEVFGNVEFIKNNFSTNPDHSIAMSSSIYEERFIYSSSLFFITTIAAKLLFTKMYQTEKIENAKQSEESMNYAGENALDIIKKSRQHA